MVNYINRNGRLRPTTGGESLSMENLKLFDAEYKFMNIVWEYEPINSTELTRLCQREFGWKKSTTYSMIKKLCERGIMKNGNATVTSLIEREQVQKYEADLLLNKVFGGSIPTFIASFLQDKTLSDKEVQETRKMIEEVTEK